MRIVIATVGLGARGGVHSYLDAILGELTALDHAVHVVAPEFGRPEAIASAGATAHTRFEDVPRPVDGIIAFVDHCALEARAAFPEAPLLAVTHGPWYAQDAPAADAEPCAAVAMSDLSLARLRGSRMVEHGVPLVRLTQPAELGAPAPAGAGTLPETPRLAVVVAHRLRSRREPLLAALADRGIAVSVLGGAEQDDDALRHIRAADIVIGIGRVVLEGMTNGRACLVLGQVGGGAWLTPETYADFESTGFVLGDGLGAPPEQFGALLDGYRPEMGRAGRELAHRHHAPAQHAARLVELLREAPAPRGPFDPEALRRQAAELRARYEARIRETVEGWHAAAPDGDLLVELDRLRRENVELDAIVEELRCDIQVLCDERDAAQRQVAEAYGSRSWRVTALLRRVEELRRERRVRR